MTSDHRIHSSSGKIHSLDSVDGLTVVSLDGGARHAYRPGELPAARQAILAAALESGAKVTLYHTGEDAVDPVVVEVREVASQPITVDHNIFMRGTQRWSPKGVCYQPTDDIDPISDDNLETIAHLLDPNTAYGLFNLGINCLRVYQVDPGKPHDKVMQLLAQNGIYVLVGAVDSKTSVHGDAKGVPAVTVKRVEQVADAFAGYANVLGFDISNELLNNDNFQNYGLVSIVKKIKQHMQTHIAARGHRAIPIGCCTRDDARYTLPATLAYACGDAATRMDFVGYNCYRWVVPHGGQPGVGTLGEYYKLYSHFKSFPIPVMLTEFGASCDGGRDWTQIPYVFGSKLVGPASPPTETADMSNAISGGFAFRYYMRNEEKGLVLKVEGSPDPVPVTSGRGGGYEALSREYRAVTAFGGQSNGVSVLDCASLPDNPYASSGPAEGLPLPVAVTLTNQISPPKEIVFSYSYSADIGTNDWIPAVTIPASGASALFTFPAGTQAIGMAYQAEEKWYGGCQLRGAALLALRNGQVINGQWVAPDGNGTCPVG